MKAKYMAAFHAALFTLASLFAAQLLAASEKSPAAGFMASAPAGMALGAEMAPEGCSAQAYLDQLMDQSGSTENSFACKLPPESDTTGLI